jgi:uncharacterized protein (TIGR02453 family)
MLSVVDVIIKTILQTKAMTTIKKSTLDFLKSIKQNNNREWYVLNKSAYIEAKSDYEVFIQKVIYEIIDFDPIMKGLEAKNCIFRFNRDTRFSNDKSPYKTNFGAFIVRGGKKNADRLAGYYIHLEPGENMLAGGAYMPPAPWLNAIREKIADEPELFSGIVNAKDFKKYFGQIEGEKLKKAPKGFPADHPQIDLLRHKSFHVVSMVKDDLILSEKFLDHTISAFKAMKPLIDFLNDY